ncbi:hypothetical protein QUF70_16360, partial [Desulfobacterales bacterium HSG17]|nr:hypothetical protein [Desulfobacterales bacterium HSG17]
MKEKYLYTMKLQYLGGVGEIFLEKETWHRIFEVPDYVTLEILSSIIQQILGWDESHLYIFKIKNIQHAFMGWDMPVILNLVFKEEKYLSCDIKLKNLNLCIDEQFFYDYDFGDQQKFSLKIQNKTITKNHPSFPKLLSYNGND